jgi:hypothetical protein
MRSERRVFVMRETCRSSCGCRNAKICAEYCHILQARPTSRITYLKQHLERHLLKTCKLSWPIRLLARRLDRLAGCVVHGPTRALLARARFGFRILLYFLRVFRQLAGRYLDQRFSVGSLDSAAPHRTRHCGYQGGSRRDERMEQRGHVTYSIGAQLIAPPLGSVCGNAAIIMTSLSHTSHVFQFILTTQSQLYELHRTCAEHLRVVCILA